MNKIAVVGGSGFYEMEGVEITGEHYPETPYGKPSDRLLTGKYKDCEVVFLPRHGRGHRYNPSCVPYRANIWALKTVGVTHILSVSAVGSLKQEIEPGHFVVPDQLMDRTKSRVNTLFDPIAVHVQFGDPFCGNMRPMLAESVKENGIQVHEAGTYVCMEGPLFSTKAESHLYRSWGASVIGMTALPEAKLAREAEICYATLAMSTDYDCWHETEEEVSVEAVIRILNQNIANAKRVLASLFSRINQLGECPCQSALQNAVMTSAEHIPEDKKEAFRPFLSKYMNL